MAKPTAIVPASATKGVFMGLYGSPGYGKTSFIGTGGKNQLVIHPPTEHMDPIIDSGVDTWEVEDHSTLNEVEEFARHEGGQYDWIWVDNWSLLQDYLLDDVWQWTIDKYPHRKEGPVDKGEYNLNFTRESAWMRSMSRAAKSQGFNFGFTAHEAELPDAITGELKLKPWIQGKSMADKFMGYMNIVAYLDLTAKGKRIFRLDATPDYDAKNQFKKFGAFPEGKLLNPTLPKLMEGLEEARAKAAKAGGQKPARAKGTAARKAAPSKARKTSTSTSRRGKATRR